MHLRRECDVWHDLGGYKDACSKDTPPRSCLWQRAVVVMYSICLALSQQHLSAGNVSILSRLSYLSSQ